MGELNKHNGVPTLARTGLVVLATTVVLLLTWAVVVAGSGASFEDSYQARPRFTELSGVTTYPIVTVNSGNSMEDVVPSTAVPVQSVPAQSAGTINTLRVYGESNLDAAFPYAADNYTGPFALTNGEAPPKDFVQFNSAIMLHTDNDSLGQFGEYFRNAIQAGGDASEKVHLRMWYVPEYPEPRGLTYPEATAPVINDAGDIVLEYTYMLLDPSTLDPRTGPSRLTLMVFPMAGVSAASDEQPGLDRMDVNGDGIPEALGINEIVGVVTGTLGAHQVVTYTGGVTDDLKTTRGIIEVSPQEALASVSVSAGGQVQFLDYMVQLEGVSLSGNWADVSIWYIGNDYGSRSLLGTIRLGLDEAALVGRYWSPRVKKYASGVAARAAAEAAMVATGLPARPFWVTLDSIVGIGGEPHARLTPKRLLMTGETFFVDSVEYDVAAILVEDADLGVGEIAPEIKYITIRNPLPKGEGYLEIRDLTVEKHRIPANESLWMLPPFNYEHDMVDDVNIPEDSNTFGPDDQEVDNTTANHIAPGYDLIEERVVADVGSLDGDLFIGWIAEAKEGRFDTNLLEEKFVQTPVGTLVWDEEWQWINVETMPWHYTEFVLPELPDKPTGEGYTSGDYVLVSSFLTEDSITTTHGAGAIRMKFAYDAEDETGIYVNEAISHKSVFRGRVKLESCGYRTLTLPVKVIEDGTVIVDEIISTDASGYFTLTLDPGTYNVWVNEAHALPKRMDGVGITAGATTECDFGELLVGDANGDNLVDISDFGVWKSTFLSTVDLRADFDLSGHVDIDDFGWIKKNFLKQGDDPLTGSASASCRGVGAAGNGASQASTASVLPAVASSDAVPLAGHSWEWETDSPIRASQTGTVTIYLDPVTNSVTSGETFTVAIRIAAGAEEMDSAQAFVDFDATYLEVVEVTGGGVLDEVYNAFDNVAGEADYAGVDLVGTVSGTSTLATITFQAKAAAPETALTFNTTSPRETKVKSGVTTVPIEMQPATVEIQGVVVSIEPSSKTVGVGDAFTLAVKVEAGAQPLDGVQAYVDFNPEYLAVTGIAGGGVLPTELYNSFSNTAGYADYAAVHLTGTVSGTFALATVTFEAVTGTAGTPTALSFHTTLPRQTRVILAESTLSSTLSGGEVVIIGRHNAYLPLVLRDYAPLQADFTASPTSGPAPLTVVFRNTSTGSYTDSLWDFGDGITSTQTNPAHTYTLAGIYTVTLTITDTSGTPILPTDVSTLIRPNYITVSTEGPPQAPSDLQATPISCSQIQLTWQDNSSNEAGFTIYDGVGYTDVASNTISYTVSGLDPASYHCFIVRAFNEHGQSDYSNWACIHTLLGTEEIANGGFEDDGDWVIPATPYPAAYTTVITRTGNRSMRVGIVEPADNRYSYSSFRQTVTIPADVISATLSFWLYPVSGEPPVTLTLPVRPLAATIEEAVLASDRQYVIVLDEYNEWINTLVWQRTNDQEWVSHEFDLSVYAGRTIKLHFGAYNDGWDGVTAMYVDDVSLQICDSAAQARLSLRRRERPRWAPNGPEIGF